MKSILGLNSRCLIISNSFTEYPLSSFSLNPRFFLCFSIKNSRYMGSCYPIFSWLGPAPNFMDYNILFSWDHTTHFIYWCYGWIIIYINNRIGLWKFILSQPYIGWISMKTCSLTNFHSPQDNIFLPVTENKFIVRNYSFSGSTSICLLEFSNNNSRI